MATRIHPAPPPFITARMSKVRYNVPRLKAGQHAGEAPAYVFECSTDNEAVAERIARSLNLMEASL